jgi:hypothetical protein
MSPVVITPYAQLMDVHRMNDAVIFIIIFLSQHPMNSHRLFHTVVMMYEKYRAEALGDLLGISPMAVRVLDVAVCLPGSRIEDVEHLLTSTRARVVSAVFELSGRGLLTYIDPSAECEDIRLYADNAASVREADSFSEIAPVLEAYRRELLGVIDRWSSRSGEMVSKALMSALTKAEFGEPVMTPSSLVH